MLSVQTVIKVLFWMLSPFGTIASFSVDRESVWLFKYVFQVKFSLKREAKKAQTALNGKYLYRLGYLGVFPLSSYEEAKKSKLVYKGLPSNFSELDVLKLHAKDAHYVQTIKLSQYSVQRFVYSEATVIYNNKRVASNLFPVLKPKVAEMYGIDLHKIIDHTDDSNSLVNHIFSDDLELSLRTLNNYRDIKFIRASKEWESIEKAILEKQLKRWLDLQELRGMSVGERNAIFNEMILEENDDILSFLEDQVDPQENDDQHPLMNPWMPQPLMY